MRKVFFILILVALVFGASHHDNYYDDDDHEEEDPKIQYFPQPVDPLSFHLETLLSINPFIIKRETPIRAHMASIQNRASWNCFAAHHPTAKDILTHKRPKYVSHHKNFNNQARCLCVIHALQTMIKGGYLPQSIDALEAVMKKYLGKITVVPNNTVILDNIKGHNPSPIEFGQYIGYQFLKYLKQDGSNFDGATGSNGEPCTANCVVYGDNGPKPYVPENNPFAPSAVYGRYKPVVDSNGLGYLTGQGFITPHIGNVKLSFLTEPYFSKEEVESRVTPPPHYDYEKEARRAIKSVKKTGTSEKRKMLSEIFDDKIRLAGVLLLQLLNKYSVGYEETLFLAAGVTLVEYESIVLTWREKIRHDTVRPITFIKEWGLKKIDSWKGPFQSTGEMNAKDWVSYFRTMPHSEYPSGSSCLCEMVADFIDTYLKDRYNDDTMPITFTFPAGSSVVEPGFTPKQNLTITLNSMTEFRDVCGKSRLWSGVHFSKSVTASYTLCEDIGVKAFQFMKELIPNGFESLKK